jgi:ATP-binding cassette, subfamily C, bacteriocin exporter
MSRIGFEYVRRHFRSKVVRQYDVADCGPAALLTVLRHYGGNASLTEVRELTATNARGTNMFALVEAAAALGLDAHGAVGTYEELTGETMPAIAHILTEDGLLHYVVVLQISPDDVRIADPARGVYRLSREQFSKVWRSGAVVLMRPTDAIRRREVPRRRDWLWRMMDGQEVYLTQSVFLGIVYAALGLFTALFVQSLVDRLIPAHASRKIVLTTVALLLIQVIRAAAGYLRQRFLFTLNQRVSTKMGEDFLTKVLRLPLGFFESRTTGDITSRLHDTARIQSAMLRVIGSATIDGLVAVGSLLLILFFSRTIGLVALAAVPVYGILFALLVRRVSAEQARVMGGFAQLDAAYIDTLRGIDTILGFHVAPAYTGRLLALNGTYQARILRLGNTQAMSFLGAELAAGALMIAALATGAWLVMRGDLLLGAMMAAYSLLSTMLGAIGRLVEASAAVQGAAVATSRLLDLLLVQSERSAGPPAPAYFGELRLDRVTFRWANGPLMLKGVDLSIPRGSITGVCGESGSGKSTLVKLLERKYEVTGGCLLVDGQDVAEFDLQSYRAAISVVPETVCIFRGTLFENIVVGRTQLGADQVLRAFADLGLDYFLARFQHGLMTAVGEDGRQLSSGERQIVGFLRAFVGQPHVLIVDEGVNAIDAHSRELVLAAIHRYAKDHAVLLISHDPQVLRHADRIYQLEDGHMFPRVRSRAAFDNDHETESFARDKEHAS